MRSKTMKIIALCAALALTVCAASCSDGKANTVSNTDVSQSDLAYGVDDGTITFPRGVWAADDGERRTGYYIITGENSGSYLDTEYGMGVGFDIEIDGHKADFHMGAADVNNYTEVFIPDIGKRTLIWEEDNRIENFILLTSENPDTFEFYSASDLLGAAYTYYESQNNGAHPEFFGTTVNTDGTVEIQLYDQVKGHNSTAAYYQVDSLTGKGKEVNSNTAVDFSGKFY